MRRGTARRHGLARSPTVLASSVSRRRLSPMETPTCLTTVEMPRAETAKRSEAMVSEIDSSSVRRQTTMVDFVLPPRLSCSSRVSDESRHGTWSPGLHSRATTVARKLRLWLMCFVSFLRSVLLDTPSDWPPADSMPARSTRLSLPE